MFTGFYDMSRRTETAEEVEALNSEVKTLQRPWEINALLDIVQGVMPATVVEIGTYKGGTLFQLMKTCEAWNRDMVFVSVDPQFESEIGAEWADRFGIDLHVINGLSEDTEIRQAVADLTPDGVDMLFIDGNHGYPFVRADFDFYGKMVNRHGIIALHDIVEAPSDPSLEVWRLWREIQVAGFKTRELLASNDGTPGGIGVVYIQ